jgi:outer membrane protein TolC
MKWILWIGTALAGAAQTPLSLPDAVKTALEKHPALAAATAQIEAAGSRVEQARAGRGPKVGWMESFQTSNNPVFAFGSLLNQRRFAESNFRIDSLNSPGFVNNFQTVVNASQTIYDGGAVKAQVKAAEIGREIGKEQRRALEMQRVAAVAQRYHAVWLAGEALKTAEAGEKSAQADLERADAVRTAGMSTDADVLSIRVHLAAMREQVLDRRQDVRVARAALNEAMGVPLDSEYDLTTPLAGVSAAPGTKTVVSSRPDLRQADLQRQAAETQGTAARAALYPQIALNGVFEADRGRFVTQAGANWFAGVTMRWNLFNGGADRRRIDEAAHQTTAARAEERQVSQSAQLELRQAEASYAAASERIGVARAAVEHARESLRIIKDRFGAGLTTVQELLRNETALVEAEMRRLRALYDQRVAAVMTELAAGTLTGDSDVLR